MRLHNALYFPLLLCPLLCLGQAASYVLEHAQYGLEAGLSNQQVYCVQADGRGILWVGTRYGLNRFDGRRFRTFTTADGLAGNLVGSIFRLDEAYLLLGLDEWEGHLPSTRRPQAFHTLAQQPVPLGQAMPAMPFEEGEIEVVSLVSGGLHFALRSGHHYFRDGIGRFMPLEWLGQGKTLWAFEPGSHAWGSSVQKDSLFVHRHDLKAGTSTQTYLGMRSNGGARLLREDGQGAAYWAQTAYRPAHKVTILRMDAQGQAKAIHQFPDQKGRFFPAESMHYDPAKGGYWCGGKDEFVFFSKDWAPLLQVANPGSAYINQQRQNHYEAQAVWQCSSTGLHRIGIQQTRFQSLFQEDPPLAFRGIARTGGRLLFNSERGIRQKTADGVSLFSTAQGLASAIGPDLAFWTGNAFQLHRFGLGSQAPHTYSIVYGELWGLWLSPDGKVWYSGRGLRCLDPATGQDTVPASDGFEELAKATVYHFHPHAGDTVWLFTTKGLYVLDARRRAVLARYWPGGKGGHYLPSGDLRHLYWYEEAGEAWIATGNQGLLHWRPATGEARLHSFLSHSMNIVHAVYPDEYGFLWLPTDDGLVQFERRSGRFRVYTVRDGLPNNEFNRCSHFRDADGRLYFGSVNGVAAFHPADFRGALLGTGTAVQPMVVEVRRSSSSGGQHEDFTASLLEGSRLRLRPSDRALSFTFALTDLGQAAGAAFFYQLRGDADWQAADGNQLSLWRLPYGRQSLLVKALLADGTFTPVLEVPLRAEPPFYLSWWFAVLAALLLAGLVYGRIWSLRRSNTLLEAQVAQRTEKIRQDKVLIEQQAEALRQLDTMKSRFFANISHELRTPLTLIASPLQRLAREEARPEQKQFLHFAARNSQRLLRLVNQILDLSKLQAAKLEAKPQEVTLRPFARRVLAEFESFAAHKGLALELRTELPELAAAHLDPNMAETVLYNLLSNALKFTPAGGRVVLKMEEDSGGLAFEVSDNGRGILPEDLPFVFDRFYQSKAQQAAEGGTGIGLAICKEFAQLMGGGMSVQSAPGQGAAFRFSLPVAIHEAAAAPLEQWETERGAALPPAAAKADRPLLLIVEDNEDLQRYIAALLQRDYRLATAANGRTALDFLEGCPEEGRPALILSDIMMPEMDGFQLLQHLKTSAAYRHIPVVMLTARTGRDDRLRALRIGVDDYLSKPFSEEELLVRIGNLIKNAGVRAALAVSAAASPSGTPSLSGQGLDEGAQWLAEVESYVLANASSATFSVSSVAAAFGLSRQTFNKRIGQAVGLTALAYLDEVRLNEARRLLEAHQVKTVRAAAAAVGMANPKLFSRKFVERFGKYPSEYL